MGVHVMITMQGVFHQTLKLLSVDLSLQISTINLTHSWSNHCNQNTWP